VTAHPDPWWWRAACLGMAPLFDAAEGTRNGRFDAGQRKAHADRQQAAARVCATCPVTVQCERDARPGRDEGIRAGKVLPPIFVHQSARERNALLDRPQVAVDSGPDAEGSAA
jgi:hypothetical protein